MNPPSRDENKGPMNRARDSSEDTSLSREKAAASAVMANYKTTDGEFSSFKEIPERTAQILTARGIKSLFPIQQHAFYPVYNREDVIARDLTGSGKTLAFCLPVTEYLRKNNLLGTRRIQAIMLCPTRELAIQVSLVFKFGCHCQSEV
jgi:superfamily II DNA/RNA helicase